MGKRKKTISANYLEYIPKHSEAIEYTIDQDGSVTILIENKGIFNKIAQKILKKPRITQIHLEEMGNFIWPLIDGKKSIMDISVLVHEHFGDKAEPLYNRLATYFRNLEGYNFVTFVNKDEIKSK